MTATHSSAVAAEPAAPPRGTPDVSGLLTPFTIGPVTVPTRFVLPPMERGLARGGRPLPALGEYYAERVRNGVGLVITECTGVDHPAAVPTSQVRACHLSDATQDAWARCIEQVHDAGGRIFPQLWHAGSFRVQDHVESLSPSGLLAPGVPNGRAATRSELEEIKDAFVRSALVAERAGADGVEIHGGHSYLLDQFLWHASNQRDDGYGGPDVRDRVRFPAEVVAAVREALSPGTAVSFRFSQYKPVDFGARVVDTPEELGIMLDALRAAGADVFHASALNFFDPAWPGSDLSLAGWTRSLTDAPVITVGSVGLDRDVWGGFGDEPLRNTGPEGVAELLRRFEADEFDLVSVGRAVMADAEWIPKVRQGRYSEIRPFSAAVDIAEIDAHPFMLAEIGAAYAALAGAPSA